MKKSTFGRDILKRLNNKVYILLIIVLVILLEASSALGNFFRDVEYWHFTERQKSLVSSRVDGEIAIIGIDNPTMSSEAIRGIFGRWPYRREAFSHIVNFLNRSSPRAIAFDLSFNGGEDLENPESDQAFVDSINRSEFPVISVFFPQDFQEGHLSFPTEFSRFSLNVSGRLDRMGYHSADAISPPIRPLLDSSMLFYSIFNFYNDESGVVRRNIPFIKLRDGSRDVFFPTLPLALTLSGEHGLEILPNASFQTANGVIDTRGQLFPYVRWYGDARGSTATLGRTRLFSQGGADRNWGPITRFLLKPFISDESKGRPSIYRHHSFSDIVLTEMFLQCRERPDRPYCDKVETPANPVDPAIFSGKYVLIGVTADNTSQDNHKTIYGGGPYPGVFIQANMLDNFLHNDFTYQVGAEWSVIGFLLIGGLTAWICLRLPIQFSIAFTIALGGSYTFFTIWAYRELSWWVNWTYPMLALFLAFAGSYVYRYFSSEQRKQQLRYAFAKYVSPAVMQTIEKNPEQISLGGQRRELTMLFSDIRGFTTFSETHEAEFVQSFLTDYFSVMNDIVLNDCGGSINKLIGDAIMAYWGFPLETEDHAFLAVRAALKMRDAMHEWNQRADRPPVRIGVGINTGEVMIGNVGSKDFMDFTVIGDAVNTAARLEGMNKEFGTNIIISEYTYAKLRGRLLARPLGAVSIRGKEQKLNIYEPIAFREDLTDDQVRALEEELSDAPPVTSQAEGA